MAEKRNPSGPLGLRIEYVGIIGILCLFAGAIIGWSMAPKSPAQSGHNHADMFSAQDSAQTAQAALQMIDQQTDPQALSEIGNHAYDTMHSSLSVAINAYEKSLAKKPNDPNVMTDLAAMYISAGKPSRAAEIARDAAKLDPKHIQSRYWLGVALAQTGDMAGARASLLEVKKISPGSELAKEAEKTLLEIDKR